MRKYATTVDNYIQERGNMPQQWIIIYRNQEICHNSGELYTGMRKYATTVDDNIQEWGNMPQQWIIIYRNEEICHNSG